MCDACHSFVTMTRLAVLLSLFVLGTLGLVACDDESATADTERIRSGFTQGSRGTGLAMRSCGDFRGKGPGGFPIAIEVLEGDVPCRVAQRVLKEHYLNRNKAPWTCAGPDRLVECQADPGLLSPDTSIAAIGQGIEPTD